MTPEEIKEKMKIIRKDDRALVDKLNDNWVEEEVLRSEYKRQTGKDL